jgi:hypothetical protein
MVEAVCYLFTLFAKNQQANLSAADKAGLRELVEGIRHRHAG